MSDQASQVTDPPYARAPTRVRRGQLASAHMVILRADRHPEDRLVRVHQHPDSCPIAEPGHPGLIERKPLDELPLGQVDHPCAAGLPMFDRLQRRAVARPRRPRRRRAILERRPSAPPQEAPDEHDPGCTRPRGACGRAALFQGVALDPVTVQELRSWRLYEPGRPPPTVVFAIASDTTWEADLAEKPAQYAALGAQEYYAYDPNRPGYFPAPGGRLRAWRLDDGVMVAQMPDAQGRVWSPAHHPSAQRPPRRVEQRRPAAAHAPLSSCPPAPFA